MRGVTEVDSRTRSLRSSNIHRMSLSQLMRALVPSRRGSRNLTADEAFSAFHAILSGSESEITVAAFLTALRMKGVTVEELTAFAQAARSHAVIPCVDVPNLVCVSPPGGGVEEVPALDVAAGLIAAGAARAS